jgi:hypothetical protein
MTETGSDEVIDDSLVFVSVETPIGLSYVHDF